MMWLGRSYKTRWVLDHALVAMCCICTSFTFTLYGEKHIYEHLYRQALERQVEFISLRKVFLMEELQPILDMPDGLEKSQLLDRKLKDTFQLLERQRNDIQMVLPSPDG